MACILETLTSSYVCGALKVLYSALDALDMVRDNDGRLADCRAAESKPIAPLPPPQPRRCRPPANDGALTGLTKSGAAALLQIPLAAAGNTLLCCDVDDTLVARAQARLQQGEPQLRPPDANMMTRYQTVFIYQIDIILFGHRTRTAVSEMDDIELAGLKAWDPRID